MTDVERRDGLVIRAHRITVPLDHANPSGPQLEVFAREIARPDAADKPCLVYLQGGPGGESPRPSTSPVSPPWVQRALADYRVILLDQRGTGLSTPVGSLPGMTPAQQADYLANFRADSIVRDAELLRESLGVDKWSLLGQSFGGFCSLHYLTRFPGSLREVMFTGGLPPIGMAIDDIYRATYARTIDLVERYYRRFPGDRAKVAAIVDLCDKGELMTTEGLQLTSHRFRQVGTVLGMSYGAGMLHYLLERDPRSPKFTADLAGMLPFTSDAPIYTVLHEASYADGVATNWSCARVRPAAYEDDPTLLTAEHPFPWLLDEVAGLRPLKEAAELLAQRDWPKLYDAAALADVDVPCAAAVYYDDPYVLREHSTATAAVLPGMRPWITNEYLHDGVRADGRVLDRLISLVKG